MEAVMGNIHPITTNHMLPSKRLRLSPDFSRRI